MSCAGESALPSVIVLGGCGFIGRNLVHYLVSNDLAPRVRVVDKTPPQLAFLNPAHAKTFEDPRVEYRSANLINPASCASALEPGDADATYGLVVNCAAETRTGQSEAVYREGIVKLSGNVARECIKQGLRLVEISSGYMYSSDKPQKEDGPTEPWTMEARMKREAEKELQSLAPELKYTIIRPAIVYGIADRRSLTPRLLLGAIYRHLQETMKLLWTADLRLNTVHVRDVCRAICHLAVRDDSLGQVYNVVDSGGSRQGSLAALLEDIFHVQLEYCGTALSTLARADITSVAEDAKDKHMSAWADICSRYKLDHSPLEPSTDAELLLNKHLCLDGAKLAATGFRFDVPKPTVDVVKEVLEDFASMNLFPRELLL